MGEVLTLAILNEKILKLEGGIDSALTLGLQLSDKVETDKDDILKLSERIDTIEYDADEIKGDVRYLDTKVSDIEIDCDCRLNDVEVSVETAREYIDDLSDRIDHLEDKIDNLDSMAVNLTEQIREVRQCAAAKQD